MRQMEAKNWCVEWFGSQGDFIAGKADEAVSLEHFADLESLYAVGPLEQARGEVSIYDGVPLISEVQDGQVKVAIDLAAQQHPGLRDCRKLATGNRSSTHQDRATARRPTVGLGRDKRHGRR